MPSFYVEHEGQEWRVIFGFKKYANPSDKAYIHLIIDFLYQGSIFFDGDHWIFSDKVKREIEQEQILADQVGNYILLWYQ